MATPTLFLAQSYNLSSSLPPVGAELPQGVQMVGFLADCDVLGRSKVETAARGHSPLTPLIVDTGWRYGRSEIRGEAVAPWLARKEPTTRGEWDKLVSDGLSAQRLLSPKYLVVPGIEMAGGTGVRPLQQQIAATRGAFRGRPASDPPWLARICVHDEWVRDQAQRKSLLDEISDLPDEIGIALHVRWGRRGATTDTAALTALKVVIEQFVKDDRDVVVLRSGLMGWLASGWGAVAWTAGMPRGSWADERRVPGGRQRGSKNKSWYFDKGLLLWMEGSQRDQLAQSPNYVSCSCGFCGKIARGAVWSRTAPQHALYALALLAHETVAPTTAARAAKIRSILADAEASWTACDAGSLFNARGQGATHVATWKTLF